MTTQKCSVLFLPSTALGVSPEPFKIVICDSNITNKPTVYVFIFTIWLLLMGGQSHNALLTLKDLSLGQNDQAQTQVKPASTCFIKLLRFKVPLTQVAHFH